MYYTQSGQEIEDPEMDNMRRDLQEQREANATIAQQNAGIELAIATMQQIQQTSATVANRCTAEEEAIRDWNKLLQTPGYLERDLRNVPMFAEAHSDEYLRIAESIAADDLPEIEESDLIPLVPMEDRMIHSDDRPFCDDPSCGCHSDDALFDEHIMEPMMAGLLTSWEANRIMWNEQI